MSRSTGFRVLLTFAALTLPVCAQVSVLTYHNDIARTGQNLNEVTLNSTNVQSNFGKLFTVAVDDWIVSEPLYVPNLNIGGGTHNVVFVGTLNNTVYAIDADTPNTIYWQQNYGSPTPFAGLCQDSGFEVSAHKGAGIIATPVIDLNLGRIYFVTKTGDGAGGGPYAITFYAVNIQTGATIASTPVNPGAPDWNPYIQMSRPGLAEDPTGSFIYIALGATGCKQYKYEHGYVLAFSTTTAAPVAVFATTVGIRNNGGIWQAGGGLALDVLGDIFVETADAPYDGKLNFGDSILQINSATNNLSLRDWFTPDNQSNLYTGDLDLSAVGPVLLPDQTGTTPHLLVASGKNEEVYLVNRDVGIMGRFTRGTNKIVQDIPAPSYMTGCLNQTIGGALGNTCRSGPAVYFNNQVNQFVYFTDDGASSPPSSNFSCDVVQYTVRNNGGATQLTSTPALATLGGNCTVGSPSISSNAGANGLLWFVVMKGAATALRSLDATTLAPVYSSQTNATRDSVGRVPRFSTPTIANGKVYVGGKATNGGQLLVYGLLSASRR